MGVSPPIRRSCGPGPEVNLNPLTPLLLEPVTNTNTVNAINQKSSFKSHKYHLIYIFKSRSVANLELRYLSPSLLDGCTSWRVKSIQHEDSFDFFWTFFSRQIMLQIMR